MGNLKPSILNNHLMRLGLISVSVVMVGCSSPLKYTPRDANWQTNTQNVEPRWQSGSQKNDARAQAQARFDAIEKQQAAARAASSANQPFELNTEVSQSQAFQATYVQPSDLAEPESLDAEESSSTSKAAVQPPVTKVTKSNDKVAVENSALPCSDQYRVKPKDSLSAIAFRCKLETKVLASYNSLKRPYSLDVGQLLYIPKPEQYLNNKASSNSGAQKKVVSSSRNSNSLTKLMADQWILPVSSKQDYRFIRDEQRLSVLEFYGNVGQRVNAVAPGKVAYSGNGIINFGWMVVVKHDDGFMSVYAHNSSVLVKEGDRVKAGQFIATLGDSGNANKPKLYLEARFKGKKIDIKKIYNEI